jgi:hypothetical protein
MEMDLYNSRNELFLYSIHPWAAQCSQDFGREKKTTNPPYTITAYNNMRTWNLYGLYDGQVAWFYRQAQPCYVLFLWEWNIVSHSSFPYIADALDDFHRSAAPIVAW